MLADRGFPHRLTTRCTLACALVLASACEPEVGAPPKTPPGQAAYAPNAYGGYGTPFQPWQPPPVATSAPAATGWGPPRTELPPLERDTPDARKIEAMLDEPAPAGRSLLPPDVRDPWAREARPVEAPPVAAPALPQTHLIAIVSVEAKGKYAPRLAAAKKAIAAKGGVRRGEGVWEIPTDAPDRAPSAVRSELEKVLCVDDRLTLFFVSQGALVKLEVAGSADCEAPR